MGTPSETPARALAARGPRLWRSCAESRDSYAHVPSLRAAALEKLAARILALTLSSCGGPLARACIRRSIVSMRATHLLLVLPSVVDACTTIIAGKDATVDGSVMATHSNDGEGGSDPRLVYIPPRDHASGSQRPVFFAPENYPRYVGTQRGDVPAYLPVGNQTAFRPIGSIAEVAHTYGYFEETYGALNEHQLGIGESTCSGVFGTKAAGEGGHALFSIDTLSQIVMERTTSSRDAVKARAALRSRTQSLASRQHGRAVA